MDGTLFDTILQGGIMEKIVNDNSREYPQQYTWPKFISHVLVVFLMLFIMVQVIKTLSE